MEISLRPSRNIYQRKYLIQNVVFYGFCTLLAIFFIFPLAWSFLTSLKPAIEASAVPPTGLPSSISWENYAKLNNYGVGIIRYVANSVIVTLGTVLGSLLLSTVGGYGFSRFSFPGKNILFVTILAALMIPFQSILTPLFLILHQIGLQNTLLGLILVYITFQLPFGVFMMRNAFDAVPREIEEAALLDGCSAISLLYRIMLPMILPGMVTVGLFAFFGAWNEFLAALIFLSDSENFTLPILLLNVRSGLYGSIDWGALQAGVTLTMLPCVVIFLLLQRYYVRGLLGGAIKG